MRATAFFDMGLFGLLDSSFPLGFEMVESPPGPRTVRLAGFRGMIRLSLSRIPRRHASCRHCTTFDEDTRRHRRRCPLGVSQSHTFKLLRSSRRIWPQTSQLPNTFHNCRDILGG
jgi:hypothetical protein